MPVGTGDAAARTELAHRSASAGEGGRAVLVVNPRASRVTGEGIRRVERLLRARLELETVLTKGPHDGTRIAEELSRDAGVAAVFVYSGDGGFNEVINGLAPRLPVGFIPGGRTNVLPRALGIGQDAFEAARRLADGASAGRGRRISLGRANGRRFAVSSGIGLDAEFVRAWDGLGLRRRGGKRGDIAFSAAAARVLLSKRGSIASTLEVGGDGSAAFILAANGDPYSYLGRLPLHVAPSASFDDGIELVSVLELRPWMIPGLIAHLILGRGVGADHDVVRHRHVRRCEVTCSAPLAFHMDGEDLGDVTRVVFESEPDAIEVIV
jgi:diacylglycerol kinase family enzyme